MTTSKRVALVTGGTGVIGSAIATGLACEHDFEVVLGCRDRARAERVAVSICKRDPDARIRIEVVDVSSEESVTALAARWQGPLHVLVNNAATAPRTRQETARGIELQLATNVLGYVWMTEALTPALSRWRPSRVVNVASYWAGGLDPEDLEFRRRRYDNNAAYRQSKQANRMLSVALAEQLRPAGITVNACHPGDAPSRLSHDLGFGGHETGESAARTPIWLATETVGQDFTGRYFEHMGERPCQFARGLAQVNDLYARCRAYGSSA